MVNAIGLTAAWSSWVTERGQKIYEWKMTRGKGEGPDWNFSKWKNVIGKEVKRVGLNEWKNEMERKKTSEYCKEKRNQSMKDDTMEAWVGISSSELELSVWM